MEMQMEVEKIEMLINLVVRNVYGRLCAEGRFVQGFTVSVPIPGYADELETYAMMKILERSNPVFHECICEMEITDGQFIYRIKELDFPTTEIVFSSFKNGESHKDHDKYLYPVFEKTIMELMIDDAAEEYRLDMPRESYEVLYMDACADGGNTPSWSSFRTRLDLAAKLLASLHTDDAVR